MPERISFAQNGEDVRLWRVFDSQPTGLYVEVGGWRPEDDSISRSFYDRGWDGVVIEPVPELADAFRRARPRDQVIQVLAGAAAGEATLHAVPGTGLSTTVDQYAARHRLDGYEIRDTKVPVRRISDILAEQGVVEIHFMVIDTEGSESEVLAGLDLARHRPWVMIIEATEPRSTTDQSAEWDRAVTSSGYSLAAFDGLNRFYVPDERSELAPLLATPPNVFDRYAPLHQVRLEEELRGLERARHELAAERDLAEREMVALQARLDLSRAQLLAARHNTEVAIQQRDLIQQKYEKYGIELARRVVDVARRVRTRIARR